MRGATTDAFVVPLGVLSFGLASLNGDGDGGYHHEERKNDGGRDVNRKQTRW